eukprot:Pompholyxophrys_punicea_v1_NODE_90_length_3614_cov_2.289407.p1 type:complete len:1054 gc:universal NODE_90_length_3614_cov_2.289407:3252-91(-)
MERDDIPSSEMEETVPKRKHKKHESLTREKVKKLKVDEFQEQTFQEKKERSTKKKKKKKSRSREQIQLSSMSTEDAFLPENGPKLKTLPEPQKRPLDVVIEFPKLENNVENIRANFFSHMEKRFYYWEDLNFNDLPSTSVPLKKNMVTSNNIVSSVSELNDVARGVNGALKSLNDTQKKTIIKEAVFTVESKNFPGQVHTWRLTRLLQNGRKKTYRVIKKRFALALGLFIIQVPKRFFDDHAPLSMMPALRSIKESSFDFLNSIIGASDFSTRSLVQRDSEILISVFSQMIPVRNETYVTFQNNTHSFIFFSRDYCSKILSPLLETAYERASLKFSMQEISFEKRLFQELQQSLSPTDFDEIPQLISNKKVLNFNEIFLTKILKLDLVEPVRKCLVARGRFLILHADWERQEAKKEEQHRRRVCDELVEKNPWKSMIPEWYDKQVETAMTKFHQANTLPGQQLLSESLNKNLANLNDFSYLLNKQRDFHNAREQVSPEDTPLKTSGEVVPADIFKVKRRIWFQKNWIISKENNRTYLSKNMFYNVSTVTSGWRIELWLLRTWIWILNTIYWVLFANFWYGQLSVRSLFLREPYPSAWRLSKEGNLETKYVTPTLYSRTIAIWTYVISARQQFLEAKDDAFLPRANTNFCNFLWNYCVIGIFSSFLLFLLQPLATFVNFFVTFSICLLAIPCVPLLCLCGYLCQIFFWDFDCSSYPTFPFVLILYKLLVAGVLQIITAIFIAFMGIPLASVIIVVGSLFTALLRTLYDFLAYHLVIARVARVPIENSSYAYRVGGPGITSSFHVQLPQETILFILRAHLELLELDVYEKQKLAQIRQPSTEFCNTLNHVVGGLAVVNEQSAPMKKYAALQKEAIAALDQVVKRRRTALSSHTRVPQGVRAMRADLQVIITTGTELVQEYVKTNILPRYTHELHFWAEMQLSVGNWRALALKFFEQLFTSNFLEPVEVADERYRLYMSPAKLHDVFVGFWTGKSVSLDVQTYVRRVEMMSSQQSYEPPPQTLRLQPAMILHKQTFPVLFSFLDDFAIAFKWKKLK